MCAGIAFDRSGRREEYRGRSSTAWTAAKQVGESCTEFVHGCTRWVHMYLVYGHQVYRIIEQVMNATCAEILLVVQSGIGGLYFGL